MLCEVDFFTYCPQCKYKDKKGECEPCDECLTSPMNEDSAKPINFKEEPKNGTR